MLAVIGLAYTGYVMHTLDPIYKNLGGAAHHTVWHSIYYSLPAHPDWNFKYGESHRHATGDQMPWVAAENYIARHPIQAGDPPLYLEGGFPNFVGIEKYARAAFFELARNDPQFVVETFLFYKPRGLFLITAEYLKGVLHLKGATIWLAFGLGAILVTFFAGHREELIELAKGSAVVTGALFASVAPLVITVPMISDNLFMATICTGLWLTVLLSVFARCALLPLNRIRSKRVVADDAARE
jgi:hypothetical protein